MTLLAAQHTLAPTPTRPTAPARVLAWVGGHRAMVAALVLPYLVFGIPQLFGLTFLDGDNLIQNFPMRVLVGQDLSHGSLPLWNPYLFSGTPLLGGFNAGAAYPVTWLMAVLPRFTAWTITLTVVYDVALAGMYLFLRRQALSVTAATIGAVTFAFGGYMTGQLVHVDLIAGASWLPWIVLAVFELTRTVPESPLGTEAPSAQGRSRCRWAFVLALAVGMTLLAGAAESIIDSGVLVAIYWVSRLITEGQLHRDARRSLVTSTAAVAAGVIAGVALGAAQWLPGLVFLSQSQRSNPSYAFFTSGSLNSRLVSLVVSPFILGTNQKFPAGYSATYNYPEVTSYVGVLALIAVGSLFLRRWRTRPEARSWWVWYVVLVIGLLSTLGNQTPFAHLMYLIPGMSSERLLNRNLLLVDFALAVILAWWVHVLLDRPERPEQPATGRRRRWRRGGRAELIVTWAPATVMAGFAVLLWVNAGLIGRWLEILSPFSTRERFWLAGLITLQVVVAAAITWVVVAERRFSLRTVGRLLLVGLAIDLMLFNYFTIRPPISEANAQADTATAEAFKSLVGNGRFIVYDPDRFNSTELSAFGQTDLNIYHQIQSAQGYTALTDGKYYDATGSHLQEDLDPATLGGTVWDGLNVSTLLSLPGYFVTRVPAGPGVSQGTGQPYIAFPSNSSTYAAAQTGGPASFTLPVGGSHHWYFGGVLTVQRADIPLLVGSTSEIEIGLVTPTGGTRWIPSSEVATTGDGPGRSAEVSLKSPVPAGGLVVRSIATTGSPSPQGTAPTLGVPTARTIELGDIALDGRMQSGVVPPHWVFTGTLGPFGVFHNSRAAGWATLTDPSGGAPAGRHQVVAEAPRPTGRQRMTVTTSAPAVLVRSESATKGWRASLQPVDPATGAPVGSATTETVGADGVVQTVALAHPGTYVVTFTYAPKGAVIGMVVSALTALALIGLAVWWAIGSWRRRRAERAGSTRPR
jgi:hypothetical protein